MPLRKTTMNLCVGEVYRGPQIGRVSTVVARNTIRAIDCLGSPRGKIRRLTSRLETVGGDNGYIFRILLWFETGAQGIPIASYASVREDERYEIGSRGVYAVVVLLIKAQIHLKGEA